MRRIFKLVQDWLPDEEAVTSIEYVLLASLIALVIVVSVNSVGFQLCQKYKYIAESVASALGSTANISCS
jgi:pilus assembly protein Flp/PilA